MNKTWMLAFFLLAAVAGTAPANTITFGLDTEFSGATPPSSSITPWLTALFRNSVYTTDGVDLVLSAPHLTGSEFVTEWDFNIGAIYDALLPFLNFQWQSGPASDPPTPVASADAYKADGDGYFDVNFKFPTSGNTFGAGMTSIYTLSVAGNTLQPEWFEDLSQSGGGAGPFYTAAHVQGIGTGESGWIAGNPEPQWLVPEPNPIWLVCVGTALLAAGGCYQRARR